MKKQLLFSVAVLASTFSFAQAPNIMVPTEVNPRMVKQLPTEPDYNQQKAIPVKSVEQAPLSSAAAINKVAIGTSYNMYSVLTSIQSSMSANEGLGMVAFTHRQDTAYAGGSGVIQMSFSQDNGATWSQIRTTEEGVANRYPSGVVYNPAGNTSLANAWGITVGPRTAGGWNYNYYASAALDSSAVYQQYDTNTAEASSLVRSNLQVADNGVAFTGATVDNGAVYTGGILMKGTYNAGLGGYEFVKTDMFATVPNTLEPRFFQGSAFSADGMTGYYCTFTVDTVASVYQWGSLRAFKTVDGGATWTLTPEFNLGAISALQPFLLPYTGSLDGGYPYLTMDAGMDMVVDANGALHVSCAFRSAATNHPDSANYLFGPTYLADFWGTDGTDWDATVIAAVNTAEVADADAPLGIGWDQRVQMGASPDRSKVYTVWMDTDTSVFTTATTNTFPDVLTWSMDVNTNMHTGVTNETQFTNWDGNNYWMFASGSGLSNAGNGVHIPVSTSETGLTELDPMTHFYITGIEYDASDYNMPVNVGIEELNNVSFLGGIFPNPASDMATISINLDSKSNVEVELVNSVGQVVLGTNFGSTAAGTSTINMDLSNVAPGFYVVRVLAGNNVNTQSLVIQ